MPEVQRKRLKRVGRLQVYGILVVIYAALFLDNVLGMVIVPMIPYYLKEFRRQIGCTDLESSEMSLCHISGINRSDIGTSSKSTMALNSFQENINASSSDHRPYQGIVNTPKAGMLIAAKPSIQIIAAPLIGMIIDKINYKAPLILGLLCITISSGMFAYGRYFFLLLSARGVHGIGSALCDTAGFVILAEKFQTQIERSKYQGLAIALVSIGCYIGPPFGGFCHHYFDHHTPFVIIVVLATINCVILLFVKIVRNNRQSSKQSDAKEKKSPTIRVLVDHHVMVCTGALFISGIIKTSLESTMAQWMEETMDANEFQIGIVWLPSFAFHMLGVVLVLYLMKRFAKYHWLFIMLGLVIVSTSSFLVSLCQNYLVVMAPLSAGALGLALIDTVVLPLIGRLVDAKYNGFYGIAYAIVDVAFALSYICGSLLGDVLHQYVGFRWLNVIFCLVGFLYLPLIFVLKKPCKANAKCDSEYPTPSQDAKLFESNLDFIRVH